MSNTKSEGKLFDILPPPLEKITKGNDRITFNTVEIVGEKNEWGKRKETGNEGLVHLKKETHSACSLKEDSFSENRKNEAHHMEKIADLKKKTGNNSSLIINNDRNMPVMKRMDSPKTNENTHNKIKENNDFNIASAYESLILNKDEVNAVIEENEEFRNLVENETITNFMDECLKDPLKTFEKYRSDKKVLKFIQLLIDYMCAKYSHQHINNLQKHFTFEKRN